MQRRHIGGLEVQLHEFLICALGENLTLPTTTLSRQVNPVPIGQVAIWVPRAGPDVLKKKKIPCPYRDCNPRPSITYPCHYTVYVIPVIEAVRSIFLSLELLKIYTLSIVISSTPISTNRRECEVCRQKWPYCYTLFYSQKSCV